MTSESSVAGHTSAPWMAAARPSSVVGWPVVGRMGRSICNGSWMPRKAYPDVSDADYAKFNAECEANARLIAAAPDLLASMKEIGEMPMARPDMVKALHPLIGIAEKAAFDRAAAARAKATGGA